MVYLGVAKVVITDIGELAMNKAKVADCEIIEDLYAKIQYWEYAGDIFLWVGLDECLLRNDKVRLLEGLICKKTGVAIQNQLIFCTHTHAGHDYESVDMHLLSEKIAEGFKSAQNNKKIVKKCKMLIGSNPYIFNRRLKLNDDLGSYCVMYNNECVINKKELLVDPSLQICNYLKTVENIEEDRVFSLDGAVDNRVHMWIFTDEKMEPIAINLRVNAHPVILSQSKVGNKISGDYISSLESLISQKYGCFTSTFNGSFGDTRPMIAEYSEEERDWFSGVYAESLERSLSFESDVQSIQVTSFRNHPLKLRSDLPQGHAGLLKKQNEILSALDCTKSKKRLLDELEVVNSFLLGAKQKHNRLLEVEEVEQGFVEANFSCWELGNMKIFALPGEPLTSFGANIESTTNFLPVGLSNGYLSYMPHPKNLKEGGYEDNQNVFDEVALREIIQLRSR